jgi:type VII secretion protein EccB
MQSRTDQVHSYEFFLQRVVSGLVARESDPAELPFRRLGWAGFGSVMVAIVVAAVFGVIGVLRGGGNTSWQDGDSIIKVKGSDQIYLYINERLHPMENLVSAQLATGGAEVVQVSARSLEGVPRGVTLGIPGVPHRLPGGGDLLTGPWTLCSQQRTNESGNLVTISVLGVGVTPADGEPAGDQAVLVRDTDQDAYHMVWHGYRFRIAPGLQDATLAALEIDEAQALPVRPAWLDAVPPGEDLVPSSVDVAGEPTSAINDERVSTGDVIHDGSRSFLVDSDELVQVTRIEAEILARAGAQEHELSLPGNANTRGLPPPNPASPPQENIPAFVSAAVLDRSACLVFEPGEFDPVVVAGGQLDEDAANETPRVGEGQNALVDFVDVPGGAAALVQSLPAPDAPGGQWHIVNDQGTRFALPDQSVAGMLGYNPAEQGVQMSGGLVGLLVRGPDLDPAVAGPRPAAVRDGGTG